MTFLYRLRALWRWFLRRDEIEQGLDRDLEDYVERSAAEKMQSGMTEAQAKRAARIELGGVEQTKDRVRATLALGRVESFLADVRYAIRVLGRRRTFAVVTVLTLAFGIGVNVAVFSLAENVLLRKLPVPEPERLVNLSDSGARDVGQVGGFPAFPRPSESGGVESVFSYPMFRDLERAQEPFTGLAAYRVIESVVSTGEGGRSTMGALVSGSYFPVLGLQPALGRLLGPQDDQVDGVASAAVLSYSYWQSEFGRDPDVLGRTIFVDDVPLTIVGVAPSGFRGTLLNSSILPLSVFVPISISFSDGPFATPNHDMRHVYWAHLFARLKPGVTLEQAVAMMNPLFRGVLSEAEANQLSEVSEQEREAFRTRSLVLQSGSRGQTGSQVLMAVRIGFGLLLALSSVVLLLCCANIAGLILMQATTRSGEIALRASMGASRGRLASLLFTESLVLALPAALLSLVVAWLLLRSGGLLSALPEPLPSILEAVLGVRLSIYAAVLAIGVAVLSAVLVGLMPLRQLVRTDPARVLQAYGVTQTNNRGVTRYRATLATAQVALSMALLVMAGAFVYSLAKISRVDLGIDLDSTVAVSVDLPSGQSLDTAGRVRIEEALDAIPGVSSVASSLDHLFSSALPPVLASVEGMDSDAQLVTLQGISPNLLRMFGTRMLAGREFNRTDSELQVVIVSQRFAERLGLSPSEIVGRTVDYGFAAAEIVGVVSNARVGRIASENELPLFQPLGGAGFFTFYVRGAISAGSLAVSVRETFNRIEPSMAITSIQTMEDLFRASFAIERFLAGSSTVFAVLATALAALGLYGVLSFTVAQRTREIGLRLALGAHAGGIGRLVLRQVVRMTIIGALVGVIVAWLLGLAVRNLLFGVEVGDPLVLIAAAGVLALVTAAAAYVPVRHAARVDPIVVLRYE